MGYTQEMKNPTNFWSSFEQYARKTTERSPLSWSQLVLPLTVLVVGLSVLTAKNSLVGARNTREAIEVAVKRGDYKTAQELYEKSKTGKEEKVLGIMSELEEVVYPELVVERKISALQDKLSEYPGNREIYLSLAELYRQIGNTESAAEYREKARILDPNN